MDPRALCFELLHTHMHTHAHTHAYTPTHTHTHKYYIYNTLSITMILLCCILVENTSPVFSCLPASPES